MSYLRTRIHAKVQLAPVPSYRDLASLKKSLVRAAFVSGSGEINRLRNTIARLAAKNVPGALSLAAFHRATLDSAGQRGTGVMQFNDIKAYALLITFQKIEKEFSPGYLFSFARSSACMYRGALILKPAICLNESR